MRRLIVGGIVAVFTLCTTGAFAGVAPNSGGQSMSGAKIKPPSHDSDAEKSDQAPHKEDQQGGKEEKR